MIRKILVSILVTLIVVVIVGASYQTLMSKRDLEQFPPPGKLFDVDGVALHIDCRGVGEPTVVLESGLGNSSIAWYEVMEPMAKVTRVCAYDRPGLGWSAPKSQPADAAAVAMRLHRLLQKAAIEPPYVLGGWSAGGVYIRNFRDQFPEEVLGMVLVDSSHEQQGTRLTQFFDPSAADRTVNFCAMAQPLGVIRALGSMRQLYSQNVSMRPAIMDVMVATSNFSHFCATIALEQRSFKQDVLSDTPPAQIGNIPIVVLTQGSPFDPNQAQGITEEQFNTSRHEWTVLQEELRALSPTGVRFVASEAGHAIQLEQPDLVVDVFTGMVQSLRAAPTSE